MNIQIRRRTLYFLTLTIIGMALLGTSLSNLQFQTGLPIPGAVTSQTANIPVIESVQQESKIPMLIQLPLILLFIFLFTVLIIKLANKANIKKIVLLAGGLLGILILYLLLGQAEFPSQPQSVEVPGGIELQPLTNYDFAPIGDPSKEMFWAATIILMIGAAFIIIWFIKHSLHRVQNDDLIAREATLALQAIESGQDLKNVIIRSYMQMVRITKEEQGIERLESETPREFERLLISHGMPIQPVQQLTRLFEKVRYGSKKPDLQDERAAIECLSAIRLSSADSGYGIK
jgi:hypothetical protein